MSFSIYAPHSQWPRFCRKEKYGNRFWSKNRFVWNVSRFCAVFTLKVSCESLSGREWIFWGYMVFLFVGFKWGERFNQKFHSFTAHEGRFGILLMFLRKVGLWHYINQQKSHCCNWTQSSYIVPIVCLFLRTQPVDGVRSQQRCISVVLFHRHHSNSRWGQKRKSFVVKVIEEHVIFWAKPWDFV